MICVGGCLMYVRQADVQKCKGQMRPARGLLWDWWGWPACIASCCVWIRTWAIAGRLRSSGHADQLGPHSLETQAQLRRNYLACDLKSAEAWPDVHNADGLRKSLDGCHLLSGSVGLACRSPHGRIMASTMSCDLVATVPSITSVASKACAATWQAAKSAMPLGRLLQAGEGWVRLPGMRSANMHRSGQWLPKMHLLDSRD